MSLIERWQNAEDQNILEAWTNGGRFRGRKVTDKMITDYYRKRRNAYDKDDPEYTKRDGVYFYLGEALLKVNRPAEALPYYERIVKEFEKSDYLEEAQKRIAAIKAQADTKPT